MPPEDDEGSLRQEEREMLECMYSDEELTFPDPSDRYHFVLKVPLQDTGGEALACEVSFHLPDAYPIERPDIMVQCERIRRDDNDRMLEALHEHLLGLGEDEMRVLPAINWLTDTAHEYFSKANAAVAKAAARKEAAPKTVKGFMREWCSFVSLYKDSYISGPNRFEVMTSLAKDRGLHITGMGIAGKPGGLVVEGEENDVVAFMELMRTEFFETLNPRGRKLTTRLQERWPLDQEVERFEAAEVMMKQAKDVYRRQDRDVLASGGNGPKFKAGEKERLEKAEAEDMARLKSWEAQAGRTMDLEEVNKLVEAGPPAKCTTPGIYFKCGCEAPPTREEVESKRLFKEFTIFAGKEGFEASYQDAAKIFKDLGRMDGFDQMFTYRFS
eukprot:TRINITY_DN55695_c0_g1_i1.p1 TRINITY_DN55695_c0_g1~~TRINITY_DN55695_c0_g1_i1.p1  ORF type:complete len:385 (+),score=82.60 TRINITY_DN55695_c0_g1_i1:91-1245(+)